MERSADKIIREKLESLDFLPGDYTPNMESKWALLETSLSGNRKGLLIKWPQVAAAAAIILLGFGTWIFFSNTDTRPVYHSFAGTPAVKEKQQTPFTVHVKKETVLMNNRKPFHSVPKEKISTMPLEVSALPDTIPGIRLAQSGQESYANATPVVSKKSRFTEIDFNDVPVSMQPGREPILASQQFRFRIAIGQNSGEGGNSQNNALKFQKSLSN